MAGLKEKIRAALKKPRSFIEPAADILCLAASYALLFVLPQRVNFLFWTLFFVIAVLFCIGFFRIAMPPDSARTAPDKIPGIVLVLLGIALNLAGGAAICKSQGSERGMVIAILLLIEAVVMFSIAASRADAPRTQWRMSLVLRIAAVLLAAGAVVYAAVTSVSDTAIALGVMLLIESIVLWAMGSGNNPFNPSVSSVRAVPGMQKTVRELCDALSTTDTQLGLPWVGKIRSVREDALVYGPSDGGVFVYGLYHLGRFYIASGDDLSLLDAAQADAHRVTEKPDGRGVCLSAELLPEAYAGYLLRYLESGNAVWSAKSKKSTKENV